MGGADSDELKPEHFVPFINPAERLSQKKPNHFLILCRNKAAVSCGVEVELGGLNVGSDSIVYFS